MESKRTYTRRTTQQRLDALKTLINKLELAHERRYFKIGRLREHAQKLQNRVSVGR